jgi:hypothetical protein
MMKPFEKPVHVTRPFMPPLAEFFRGLNEIWETRWLTNNGPILQRLTEDSATFSKPTTCVFSVMGLLLFRSPCDYLKNSSFKNEVEVVLPGTNAKMNEMQALMGILVLKYIEEIIPKRARIDELYRHRLQEVPGIRLARLYLTI